MTDQTEPGEVVVTVAEDLPAGVTGKVRERRTTPLQDEILISEMNAQALADNLADLRLKYEDRLQAIENTLASQKQILLDMQRVYGQLLQVNLGSGPTTQE